MSPKQKYRNLRRSKLKNNREIYYQETRATGLCYAVSTTHTFPKQFPTLNRNEWVTSFSFTQAESYFPKWVRFVSFSLHSILHYIECDFHRGENVFFHMVAKVAAVAAEFKHRTGGVVVLTVCILSFLRKTRGICPHGKWSRWLETMSGEKVFDGCDDALTNTSSPWWWL